MLCYSKPLRGDSGKFIGRLNANNSKLKQPGWVRLLNYKMFTFAGSTLNEHGFSNDFVLF